MTENPTGNQITTRSYWENYYQAAKADRSQVERIGSVYDKYWARCVTKHSKTVVEIGAYPGRYLAYVATKFSLSPTAVDFQSDLSVIGKTLEAVGVESYHLINEDFLSWKTDSTYDLVLSIGFVEHFDNYEEVIAKHFDLLRKGGMAFFVVPNKRGLRWWYGMLADRENLKAHNLDAMSLDVFREAAARNRSSIEILEYSGPFQYGLHGDDITVFRHIVFSVFRVFFKKLRLNRLVEKYPSRFWSSAIVCIAKRNDAL